MKIRASQNISSTLPDEIFSTLLKYRKIRNFNPEYWVKAKVLAISNYFSKCNLSGAVLGVSGGVDSAIVAAILNEVRKLKNSPLKKITLLSLPSFNDVGATGQSEAFERAQELSNSLKLELHVIDMNSGLNLFREKISSSIGAPMTPWAMGQGVAVMRTYSLYQTAALLTQEGFPSIVIGTINRDEGSYLGYVGKSGDGMVDLQVISDLHKSEVYAVAEYLNIPDCILDAIPTGDMFDACPDTDVFGATYDAVELFLYSRSLVPEYIWEKELLSWNQDSFKYWEQVSTNLTNLHNYNSHKYTVGSPAVHLDLMDSAVVGGWKVYSQTPYVAHNTVMPRFPSHRVLESGDRREWINLSTLSVSPKDDNALKVHIPSLLNLKGLEVFIKTFQEGDWIKSNQYGQWRSEKQLSGEPINGSCRTTILDEPLAHSIWEAICHHLPSFRIGNEFSRFETEENEVWRPVGVNPVFRLMKYEDINDCLITHYDGPITIGEFKSGMTFLIYIELPEDGGELRFIKNETYVKTKDLILKDWDKNASNEEVDFIPNIKAGDAIIFDHYQLHDSPPLKKGKKFLIRSDILFAKVGS